MMSNHSTESMKNKVTVYLSDSTNSRLKVFAKDLKIGRSEAVRRAMDHYFQAADLEALFFEAFKITNEKLDELNQKIDKVLAVRKK